MEPQNTRREDAPATQRVVATDGPASPRPLESSTSWSSIRQLILQAKRSVGPAGARSEPEANAAGERVARSLAQRSPEPHAVQRASGRVKPMDALKSTGSPSTRPIQRVLRVGASKKGKAPKAVQAHTATAKKKKLQPDNAAWATLAGWVTDGTDDATRIFGTWEAALTAAEGGPVAPVETAGEKAQRETLADVTDVTITKQVATGPYTLDVYLDIDQLKHQPIGQKIGTRVTSAGNTFKDASKDWHKGKTLVHMRDWAKGLPLGADGSKTYHGQATPVDEIHYEGYCLFVGTTNRIVSFHCYPANKSKMKL